MPASDDPADWRGGNLLTVLFWAGVGVAPLAALLLLLGQGDKPLRVAAVLAVLAVVLIGLSIALRPSADTVRLDMEETLLDEIDMLREDLRNEIGAAARGTHQAFDERLQAVHANVEALRGQLDAVRAESDALAQDHSVSDHYVSGRSGPDHSAPDHSAPDHSASDRSVSGRSGSGRSARDRSGYDRGDSAAAGQPAYPGHVAASAAVAANPSETPVGQPGTAPGHRQSGPGGHPGSVDRGYQVGGRASVPPLGASGRPRPHGSGALVHHTETVQVTTRQTIVGPNPDDSDASRPYGGGVYGHSGPGDGDHGERGGDWSAPRRGRRAAEPDEESWTDHLRGYPGGDARRPTYERRDDDAGRDDRWSGMRAGDRWASVRSDERGRELRVGERRAAVHADEAGAEMRMEDRWTAVRHEERRREDSRRDDGYSSNDHRRDGHRTDDRWLDGRRSEDPGLPDKGWESSEDDSWGGGRDRRGNALALPAGGGQAAGSWSPGWAERAPERAWAEPERAWAERAPERAWAEPEPARAWAEPEPVRAWAEEPARRGRRDRDEGNRYLPEEHAPRAGGRYRRPDYEISDDRWR